MSFVAALSVADLARDVVPEALVRLKWPNDVMVAGSKVAGILIESGTASPGVLWLAIGVGVNLISPPEVTERPATTLAAHMKQDRTSPPTPAEAMSRLGSAMLHWLEVWENQGVEALLAAWAAQAQGFGERCVVRLERATLEGTALGIDPDGAFRLRLSDGSVQRITAGGRLLSPRRRRRSPMMLLAIEQGNTNTLFAVHDERNWVAQWRAATEASRTADEYGVWLHQLLSMQALGFADIDACIISSVVPQSLFNLRNLSRRYLKVEPLVIGENADLGVEVRIEKPSEAGADRLVNTIGAFMAHGGDLIVIDSGTATTLDVVGSDGAFEGGVIAPGINLSMQALHDAAARLPRVAIKKPQNVIGKDTVGAMQSGVFWGYVALIEGLVDRIKAQYQRPMKVIGTGGVASLFEGATTKIDLFDQDLTLKGLLEINRRNPR